MGMGLSTDLDKPQILLKQSRVFFEEIHRHFAKTAIISTICMNSGYLHTSKNGKNSVFQLGNHSKLFEKNRTNVNNKNENFKSGLNALTVLFPGIVSVRICESSHKIVQDEEDDISIFLTFSRIGRTFSSK
jgi:hypothetical protein